jgi:hypothetical protein
VARRNGRRRITDAELVTLCMAQAIMGIPSDRRFLAVARKHLVHLFPVLPSQPAYWKRRRRLADAIEWLMGVFASQSPGFLAPIRQRIESIFWTCKDVLILERHGARTLAGLRERILRRFLCLAACISLNHRLGRPSRALVDYCA